MSTVGLKRWKLPVGFSVLARFVHPLWRLEENYILLMTSNCAKRYSWRGVAARTLVPSLFGPAHYRCSPKFPTNQNVISYFKLKTLRRHQMAMMAYQGFIGHCDPWAELGNRWSRMREDRGRTKVLPVCKSSLTTTTRNQHNWRGKS